MSEKELQRIADEADFCFFGGFVLKFKQKVFL